jgi:hypothetical protein
MHESFNLTKVGFLNDEKNKIVYDKANDTLSSEKATS